MPTRRFSGMFFSNLNILTLTFRLDAQTLHKHYTPEIQNRYQKLPCFKGVTFSKHFQTIILGIQPLVFGSVSITKHLHVVLNATKSQEAITVFALMQWVSRCQEKNTFCEPPRLHVHFAILQLYQCILYLLVCNASSLINLSNGMNWHNFKTPSKVI